MEYRVLGSTGLKVSAIGLGTWAMGGRWWGPTNDADSVAVIHKALDLGINLFDTADIYGFGHSEKLLRQALSGRRQDVIISTKVGLRWNNKGKVWHDLSPQHITRAVDASLDRLGTDYIDLYQVHWPDPKVPVEKTAAALNKCVEVGKVRCLGVSNLSPEQMAEYREYGRFETCQPPLNLFQRHAEVAVLPFCVQENMGVLSYSTLCRGLLSGRFKKDDEIKETVRKQDPLFGGEAYVRNLAVVQQLKEFAAAYGKTVAQLAVAWVLAHFGLTSALCGARREAQLEENVGAAGWRLRHEEIKKVDEIMTILNE